MTSSVKSDSKSSWWSWLALAVVLVITAVIYADLWNAPPLAWDDDSNIFHNPYFRMGVWWWIWKEPYFGLYVPVTSSIWMALLALSKGEAWPFRALNLGLHLINTIFVYIILRSFWRRWFERSGGQSSAADSKLALVAVTLATAFFALHPLQVQAVAWISGGRDLLAAFFSLACILIYYSRPSESGYFSALILFVLALLSKPNVVVLPALILFVDIWLNPKSARQSGLRLLPWFVFGVVAVVLTRLGQDAHFAVQFSWWQRPLLMLDSMRFYISKTIWPFPLSANYAHTPVRVLADPLTIWKSLLTLLCTLGFIFWAWRRDRRYLLTCLWILILLPISGLVPFAFQNIGGVADHYNYLALAVVALLLLPVLHTLQRRPWLLLVPMFVISGLGYATWSRLPVWMSDTSFFMDMAKTSPNSFNTQLGMSVVMCADVKDYTSGLDWAERALVQSPNDILALANIAFCYSNSGQTKSVIAMKDYLPRLDRRALKELQPTGYSSLLASIGSAMIAERQYQEGFQYFCEAYRVKPSEPNHAKNVEAGATILKSKGLTATCLPFEFN